VIIDDQSITFHSEDQSYSVDRSFGQIIDVKGTVSDGKEIEIEIYRPFGPCQISAL
tara:strand:+ start:1428 stop:1595 length:168 start_codon:yes stop_codon:yes gene_type:complete